MNIPVIIKREGSSLIAFFPREPGSVLNVDSCEFYCTTDGWGHADTFYAARLKPADDDQRKAMLLRLKNWISEPLVVRRRFTEDDRQERIRRLNRTR